MFDFSKLLGRMREKGVTQVELADKIGMSDVSLIQRLKGRRLFKSNEVVAICEALEIPAYRIPEYFFTKSVKETEQGAER